MDTKRQLSLAEIVARNLQPGGLQENNHYHLSRYHQTCSNNAFIAFDESPLLTGDTLKNSSSQPLFGLPFSCKDNINARGFATTAGTKGLKDYWPDSDAAIIARLKDLGAMLCGKNNMHELSFGVTSLNDAWGAVENPVHPGHIAGGSSGGSAAAVAAGVSTFAVGTDTGGSARIPAALCGVSGFRPTTGRYPCSGIIPVSGTKDTPGFIAPTAEDIALLDAVLMNEAPIVPEKPVRLGLPAEFMWCDLADDVRMVCDDAVSRLECAGVEIIRFDDSLIGELNQSVQFPVPFYEFFVDFPRFLLKEGIRQSFNAILEQISDQAVSQILQTQIRQGRVSWDDYLVGMHAIGDMRALWQETFAKYKITAIVYPTVSCSVPRIAEADDPAVFEKLVRNTDIASSIGAPSLTLPVGLSGQLSVGLSLDGLPGEDRLLLSQAMAISAILLQD
ncbi:amidase family protein [Xenorhabdus thailandensis]|uniref:amidase family protein n=1 Tax=Xenorhabdus thailandensis TaxID=3136255 RepID=UPI0030F3B9B5